MSNTTGLRNTSRVIQEVKGIHHEQYKGLRNTSRVIQKVKGIHHEQYKGFNEYLMSITKG
jgi:hypothetical protein